MWVPQVKVTVGLKTLHAFEACQRKLEECEDALHPSPLTLRERVAVRSGIPLLMLVGLLVVSFAICSPTAFQELEAS